MTGPKKSYTSGQIGFGVLLTLSFLFLTLSLLSWSPQDPPGNVFYTLAPLPVHNICGELGARCADFLVRFCGVGAWFLLIPIFFRIVSYWRLDKLDCSVTKTCGVILILTAISGAASLFLPDIINFLENAKPESQQTQELFSTAAKRLAAAETELGLGGQLGIVTLYLLSNKLLFTTLGISIFLTFTFISGLILSCNTKIFHPILRICGILTLVESFLSRQNPNEVENLTEHPVLPEEEIQLIQQTNEHKEDGSETDLLEGTAPESETEIPEPESSETLPSGELPAKSLGAFSSVLRGVLPQKPESDEIKKSVPQTAPEPIRKKYELPSIDILPHAPKIDRSDYVSKLEAEAERLQRAFQDYNCAVEVVDYQSGPVITLFELKLSRGLRIAQVQNLSNDLAIAMKVPSVRIVTIPGKNSVGVEIPNKNRQFVRLRDVMEEGAETAAKMAIPLFIGKDVTGDPIVSDLCKLPHLLIAGRTGTGKSVCLNSIILSILMTRTPEEVRLILIDPKMVELSPYKQVPHLMHPVVTDMKRASAVFAWLADKMDERYALLARVGVRQLKEYNKLSPERLRQRFGPETEEEWLKVPKKIPSIVVIADEMADMLAVAGKEIQEYIARLAQKSRAVGIYLILATQKPTVDVVTSIIKSNLPARIAFGVASQSDSRVILDANGADKLLGNGDLLFLDSATNQIIRGQGTFIDDDEIFAVNCEIMVDQPDFVVIDSDDEGGRQLRRQRNEDPLYDSAVELVLSERRGSTSLLQRRFSIGYGRAAKIIDAMEEDGIIGPKSENDSKPRKVLITLEEWQANRDPDIEPPKPHIPAPFIPTPEYRRPEPVSQYTEPEEEEEEEEYPETGSEYDFSDEENEESDWDEEDSWNEEDQEEDWPEEPDEPDDMTGSETEPDGEEPNFAEDERTEPEGYSNSPAMSPDRTPEEPKRQTTPSRPHSNLRDLAKQRRLRKNRGRGRR